MARGSKSAAKKLDREGLWEYSLRTLGGRAMSAGELRQRLARRAADASDIEPVITRLKQCAALDDSRFAETFAASRLQNKGFGKMRVLRDLRQRRVAPPVAEKAVAGAYQETDEAELIEAFLKRKFRGKNLPQFLGEPANLASAYRKLRLAGFGGSNSIRILKQYSLMADQLEDIEDTEAEL